MRKTLFSLALAMAVLSSCSSDDIVNNPMNEENHSFPASRSLHFKPKLYTGIYQQQKTHNSINDIGTQYTQTH